MRTTFFMGQDNGGDMKQAGRTKMGRALMLVLAIALLGLAAAAAGCGTQASAGGNGGQSKLTKDVYAQIEKGMSVDQLKSLVGEPARKESKSMGGGHSMGDGSSMGASMNMEYWYYQGDKGWVRLEVTDGKVYSKSGY